MPIDPPESRDAHSQIGHNRTTAGPVKSLAPRGFDLRGAPASNPVRAEDPGQPFPVAPGGVVGIPIRPRRFVSPLPAEASLVLDRKPISLVERLVANDRALREHNRQAMGGNIGFAVFIFALVFMIALIATGGQF